MKQIANQKERTCMNNQSVIYLNSGYCKQNILSGPSDPEGVLILTDTNGHSTLLKLAKSCGQVRTLSTRYWQCQRKIPFMRMSERIKLFPKVF